MLKRVAPFYVTIMCLLGLVGSFRVHHADNRGTLQWVAEKYCETTHPIETWSYVGGTRGSCERQHIIQQNGVDEICKSDVDECNDRTVWWSTIRHTFTDRKKFNGTSASGFPEDVPGSINSQSYNRFNLFDAYKMGVYGTQWSTLFIDYKNKNTTFIPFKFDIGSNLLYFLGWIINIPQKFWNNGLFLIVSGNFILIPDFVLEVLLLPIEIAMALLSTIIGVVAGVVGVTWDIVSGVGRGLLHPLDTIFSIFSVPGIIWSTFFTIMNWFFLMIEAAWKAIYLLFKPLTWI